MVSLPLAAEWMRFKANRINLVLTAVMLLALCASAAWSGLSASQQRQAAAQQHAEWQARLDQRQRAADSPGAVGKPDPAVAARAAFDFARDDPAPAPLPGLGALALGVRQFGLMGTDIRVSVESRHADGRRSDPLSNPLLSDAGLLDFAVVVALVVPLSLIGLCHGLVQEAREQGIWRLVCAQSRAPWVGLFCALLVRLGVVLGIVFLTSILAFCLDPGASAGAFWRWMAAALIFGFCCTAVCGLFNAMPISSGACALGMLALWLACTFAVPSALSRASGTEPGVASRLEAIVRMRAIAQDAEERMPELLAQWYARQPQHAPEREQKHAWPVSFVPRYLEQDSRVRPLMLQFEHARERRLAWIEERAWLSPPLALVLAGDRLAGIDAARYARYVEEVNAFEDAWRAFFVPRIMSYRGVEGAGLGSVPRYRSAARSQLRSWGPVLLAQAALALALWALLVGVSRRLLRP